MAEQGKEPKFLLYNCLFEVQHFKKVFFKNVRCHSLQGFVIHFR